MKEERSVKGGVRTQVGYGVGLHVISGSGEEEGPERKGEGWEDHVFSTGHTGTGECLHHHSERSILEFRLPLPTLRDLEETLNLYRFPVPRVGREHPGPRETDRPEYRTGQVVHVSFAEPRESPGTRKHHPRLLQIH